MTDTGVWSTCSLGCAESAREQVLTNGSKELSIEGENRMDAPIEVTLRMLREFAGVNTHKIGIAAGLTARQVEQLEIGDYRPSPDELLSVARAVRAAVEVKCAKLKRQRLAKREKERRWRERLVENENNSEKARIYASRVRALAKGRATKAAQRAAQVQAVEAVESVGSLPVAAPELQQAG